MNASCAWIMWLCMYCSFVLAKMNELQARDLRAWCPLMHAAWSGSADVFRAVVVAIEDNLGRDQVWLHRSLCWYVNVRNGFINASAFCNGCMWESRISVLLLEFCNLVCKEYIGFHNSVVLWRNAFMGFPLEIDGVFTPGDTSSSQTFFLVVGARTRYTA